MLAMIPDVKRQEEASDNFLGWVTILESDINLGQLIPVVVDV